MTTYKKSHKRKLSSLVKQQVPEYVLTDHPKFTEFLKAYYLFMESAELQLDTITAIDQVLLETETATISHLLFDQTDTAGLDKGSRVVVQSAVKYKDQEIEILRSLNAEKDEEPLIQEEQIQVSENADTTETPKVSASAEKSEAPVEELPTSSKEIQNNDSSKDTEKE